MFTRNKSDSVGINQRLSSRGNAVVGGFKKNVAVCHHVKPAHTLKTDNQDRKNSPLVGFDICSRNADYSGIKYLQYSSNSVSVVFFFFSFKLSSAQLSKHHYLFLFIKSDCVHIFPTSRHEHL